MADYDGEDQQGQETEQDDQESQRQDEMSGEGNQDESTEEGNGQAEDEVVITIGEDSPPQEEVEKQEAPQWVKDLRKRERELARENRELKAAQSAKAEPSAAQHLGPKPTFEECGFDDEAYEQKLAAWFEQKRAQDEASASKQREQEQAVKAWQEKLGGYNTAKASLKVSDFEDAEATALDHLSVMQQQIILEGCKTPTAAAQLIYALGKNPAKLKELASIQNPVQYAFAAADLVNQMKVTSRKAPPAPEKQIRSSAPAVGVNDPKLARLEKRADETGDRTELVRYKAQLKAKANA